MSMERDFKGVWIPKNIWLNGDLSLIEKCLIVEIDSLDNDPETGCFASNEYLSKFIGISEGTCANIISGLKKRGYIIQVFFDGRNRGLRSLINVDRKNESSVHENVKADFTKSLKQRSRKREHSNTDNSTKTNTEDNIPAEPVNTPKTEPWTKKIASLFDEVNEAEHDRAGIENFQRFNWRANAGRQFAAIKQLRLCMATDLVPQAGGPPTEEDFERGFKAIFEWGFRYLKKIADAKGGPVMFSPASVLNNYNQILSYARSTRKDGSSINDKRQRDFEDTLKMVMELKF